MHEPISVGAPGVDPARPFGDPGLARAAADREPLARQARETDAGRQLLRCFPRWRQALDHLRWAALVRLARDEPVDPNDPDAWAGRDQHAHAILRRHGITGVAPTRLTLQAIGRLIDVRHSANRRKQRRQGVGAMRRLCGQRRVIGSTPGCGRTGIDLA